MPAVRMPHLSLVPEIAIPSADVGEHPPRLSPDILASPWSFCLRVSGAVAPSAPGVPDLSRVDGGGYRPGQGRGQGRVALPFDA